MKILTAFILIGITSPALADHYALGPKATAPRANTNSTVWDAVCPSGTIVISGTCVVRAGSSATLQMFWHDASSNKWSCAWSGPVTEADVQAMCAKSN
jgi:hypothetical protein